MKRLLAAMAIICLSVPAFAAKPVECTVKGGAKGGSVQLWAGSVSEAKIEKIAVTAYHSLELSLQTDSFLKAQLLQKDTEVLVGELQTDSTLGATVSWPVQGEKGGKEYTAIVLACKGY